MFHVKLSTQNEAIRIRVIEVKAKGCCNVLYIFFRERLSMVLLLSCFLQPESHEVNIVLTDTLKHFV